MSAHKGYVQFGVPEEQIMSFLSEGNAGASVALMVLAEKVQVIDPAGLFLFYAQYLEQLEVKGERLYILQSKVCQGRVTYLVPLLLGYQLQIDGVTKKSINAAIDSRQNNFDFMAIAQAIKEKSPDFNLEAIEAVDDVLSNATRSQ